MIVENLLTDNGFSPNASSTYSEKQSDMCFLYIGTNENNFEHLSFRFQAGYREATLTDSVKFLKELFYQNSSLPDVLFIDTLPEEDRLSELEYLLKQNVLLAGIPVIYHEKQLSDIQIKRLKHSSVIDDILSINSRDINYSSKIIFLKQSKIHNRLFAAAASPGEEEKKRRTVNMSYLLKRATDISLASAALLLLSPVLLLIAIIIKCESKGSVFYTALRAGKGFKTFKFYKFRSMVANADKHVDSLAGNNQYSVDENGPKFFKVSNDPRVTKFGKLLRNTSADELPQLLNVIKGDMSLVGNRPLPIYEAISLTTDDFVERFSAPAGITGLWQVNKRGKADMSTEERINLDITYSRKNNFIYDLKILVKTPLAIFQKSNV